MYTCRRIGEEVVARIRARRGRWGTVWGIGRTTLIACAISLKYCGNRSESEDTDLSIISKGYSLCWHHVFAGMLGPVFVRLITEIAARAVISHGNLQTFA